VARDKEIDKQCIGVAVGGDPAGPFTHPNEKAFICQGERGGSIDPYQDVDGKLYLFWKNDGNCCGLEVALRVQELSPDGLTLIGEPVKLIVRDQPWERPLIENPSFFTDPKGNVWMAYHAWTGAEVGYSEGGERSLHIDLVTFEEDKPVTNGPSSTSQLFP
jgi:hypothetical protein